MIADPLQPKAIESRQVTAVQKFLLAILLFGLIATGGELLLTGHTEGFWQWVPLALILASLVIMAWHGLAPSAASVRVFQMTMLLFIASGGVGLFLHYDGKVEFKLESDPSLAGWALFKDAMSSAMPPALAPAAMVHLGLLGLACVYKHPALPARVK